MNSSLVFSCYFSTRALIEYVSLSRSWRSLELDIFIKRNLYIPVMTDYYEFDLIFHNGRVKTEVFCGVLSSILFLYSVYKFQSMMTSGEYADLVHISNVISVSAITTGQCDIFFF